MRTLAHLVIGASLAATLAAGTAHAAGSPDPKAAAQAITTVYVPIGLTRAVAASCDKVDAAGAAAHAAALDAWRRANDADRLERLLERAMAGFGTLDQNRSKLDGALTAQADALIQKTPLLCAALPALFGDKTFALADKAPAARAVLEAMAGTMPQPKTLYTAGQLSALAAEGWRQAPPGDDTDRTDWVSKVLGRTGLIAVSGRAIDSDTIQQWTADRQSLWSVRCDFADDTEERLFRQQEGRDVVVSGHIDRVYDFELVTLDGCRLLDGADGIAKANLPDDAGLTPKPKTLFSVGQLSALGAGLLQRVPGKDDDEKSEAAVAAMQQLGPVAVAGRVIGSDDLQQWLPEQRSIWTVSCDFADKTEEARFEQARGRDVTILGQVSRVYAFKVIKLSGCRQLADAGGIARSDLPETDLLEYRPPSAEEVYAGADKGVPADQIEAVLFREQFQIGINPMGGGTYTDRNEESYLLLKDGTGYRYDFAYPPTDLDAAQVRRRAPQDWSRWEHPDDTYVMTAAAGPKADLPSFTVLKPFPADARLDHSYYYLNVSQGGVTTRITYVFRPDGTFERHQSGSFFMHSLAGTGPDGGSVGGSGGGFGAVMNENGFSVGGATKSHDSAGRYRLDGYALQLTAEDGTVTRLRIGVAVGDAAAPDTLNIGGTSYWDAAKE
ncbi:MULTISPECIES: hypothetical protein [unclassified Inquilinus]|uniref:hypothetical protein n=1 Tax=unclassified Inquilinus TaxID=2645927 RepID=UPI003F9007C6